jgi:hypothetical protein
MEQGRQYLEWIISHSNKGGLAHLFDVLRCFMLHFVNGGSSAPLGVAQLQRIYASPITPIRGDVTRVLQVEQDKS